MLISPAPNPNPEIIAWARREGGFPVQRVAKRLQVREEQVTAWESGRQHPTVRQTMKLAQLYHRPLSLFYQPAPPRHAPLGAEHRRLPNVPPGEESPELRLAVRHMSARRETALDLYEELGHPIPEFRLSARSTEDPRAVGERLRRAVGIASETQLNWRDPWQAWREWRSALEDLGVLVFMFPKVELSEVRGICLLDTPLPVAAVNTREVPEARPYTALHEVVHLMLSAANEEAPALSDAHSEADWLEIERFAETAASYAVIEEEALRQALSPAASPESADVRRIALKFKVTPLALATRLRRSGYWTWERYNAWRGEWDLHVRNLPPRGKGFATPVAKTIGRAGRGFSQLVLEAFDLNRINTAEAARYLNLRTDQFDELRHRLVAGSASEATDE
ncbi:MAG: hypothetical protein KIS66_16615 [Fimbriimonadaceae bacterium]|nr:hypothetical protein [Fimbriimonadaceae bacterium]